MAGESVILIGTQPAKLLYAPIQLGSVHVRDHYDRAAVTYDESRDYVVDYSAGTIARTPASRIADFSTNVLFGQRDFDHSRFPGYGNTKFFAWVDYVKPGPAAPPLAPAVDQSDRLRRSGQKLRGGGPFKIIAFGDSITAGGEASRPELQFPALYAASLQKRFPRSQITLENTATGGDTSVNGLARLQEKVLSRRPDLVLVAFGMNDHNLSGVGGVEPAAFRANLESMVQQIRQSTGADVILLSTFPPNPLWHYGSHRMGEYAAATRQAADETHAGYADVYAVFTKVLERKSPESLLANNINHPNDFGHHLYFLALDAIKF